MFTGPALGRYLKAPEIESNFFTREKSLNDSWVLLPPPPKPKSLFMSLLLKLIAGTFQKQEVGLVQVA